MPFPFCSMLEEEGLALAPIPALLKAGTYRNIV